MRKRKLFFTALFVAGFSIFSCGGGGGGTSSSSPTSTPQQGQFNDAPVDGLIYETSSGIKGFTKNGGKFKYYLGDIVTFYLGNIKLGSVKLNKANASIWPKDLFEEITDINKRLQAEEIISSYLYNSVKNNQNQVWKIDTQKVNTKYTKNIDLEEEVIRGLENGILQLDLYDDGKNEVDIDLTQNIKKVDFDGDGKDDLEKVKTHLNKSKLSELMGVLNNMNGKNVNLHLGNEKYSCKFSLKLPTQTQNRNYEINLSCQNNKSINFTLNENDVSLLDNQSKYVYLGKEDVKEVKFFDINNKKMMYIEIIEGEKNNNNNPNDSNNTVKIIDSIFSKFDENLIRFRRSYNEEKEFYFICKFSNYLNDNNAVSGVLTECSDDGWNNTKIELRKIEPKYIYINKNDISIKTSIFWANDKLDNSEPMLTTVYTNYSDKDKFGVYEFIRLGENDNSLEEFEKYLSIYSGKVKLREEKENAIADICDFSYNIETKEYKLCGETGTIVNENRRIYLDTGSIRKEVVYYDDSSFHFVFIDPTTKKQYEVKPSIFELSLFALSGKVKVKAKDGSEPEKICDFSYDGTTKGYTLCGETGKIEYMNKRIYMNSNGKLKEVISDELEGETGFSYLDKQNNKIYYVIKIIN